MIFIHCPVEVLDVHPDVHPATFDGAMDHRTQLRDLMGEDSKRPTRPPEELCGTLVT